MTAALPRGKLARYVGRRRAAETSVQDGSAAARAGTARVAQNGAG
jgi:hypothetical protein